MKKQTREEKIDKLLDLAAGKITPDGLKPMSYKVWRKKQDVYHNSEGNALSESDFKARRSPSVTDIVVIRQRQISPEA